MTDIKEAHGLEVVAWQDAENPLYTTGEKRQMHGWATDGYPVVELCRLSDAQRAIAEFKRDAARYRLLRCRTTTERIDLISHVYDTDMDNHIDAAMRIEGNE